MALGQTGWGSGAVTAAAMLGIPTMGYRAAQTESLRQALDQNEQLLPLRTDLLKAQIADVLAKPEERQLQHAMQWMTQLRLVDALGETKRHNAENERLRKEGNDLRAERNRLAGWKLVEGPAGSYWVPAPGAQGSAPPYPQAGISAQASAAVPTMTADTVRGQSIEGPGGFTGMVPDGQGGYRPAGGPPQQMPMTPGAGRNPAMPAGAPPPSLSPGGTVAPAPGLNNAQGTQLERMRKEMMDQVDSINSVQQNITSIKQLLRTGGPLAQENVRQMLTGWLDPKNRATNLLFNTYGNWGPYYQRISGWISKMLTGELTEAQLKDVWEMVDKMEKDVLVPTRGRIQKYYEGQAGRFNIPTQYIQLPPNLQQPTRQQTPQQGQQGQPAPVTATNPQTGQKIMFNPETGQWQPMGQ